MKKTFRLTFIFLLSSYSFSALSQDMTAMIKQQMLSSMTAMCNDRNFLDCAGLKKQKCVSAVNSTISSCDHLFPKGNAAMNDDAFDAHGNCMERNFPKNSGVSANRLDTCDTDHAEEAPVDMAEGIAMMNQMLQQHADTIGTDGVTLPLYENARVMSHFASGEMSQAVGVDTLPALVMTSPDNTDKIASYYRSQLNGFREHRFDGDILFMKGGPINFDFMRDYKTYAVTPHVYIAPMQEGLGVPPGTRSKIEIAYEK